MSRTRNIIVTGGCGFIGTHLCHRLVREGACVTIIDDLSSGVAARKPKQATLIEATVLDENVVRKALAGADAVVHLAAIASVPVCQTHPFESHIVNQSAFIRFLAFAGAAKKVGRDLPIVFASSAAVYGDTGDVPIIAEDAPKAPISNYGADKLGLEIQAHAAHAMWGVSSIGLRFFNVFGPGQTASSPYSGVISRFLADIRTSGQATIFGDGLQSRDFIHVDDVVEALVLSLRNASGRCAAYNVCTGVETSVFALHAAISKALNVEPKVELRPARPGDIRRSVGDGAKARHELRFAARRSLGEGLLALAGNMT